MKRLEALNVLIKHSRIDCKIFEYNPSDWLEKISGLENEPEGGLRCEKCFEVQLEAGACLAKKLGIKNFSTTLTISPHKNVKLINEIGEHVSAFYGITWQSRVWRKNNGFLRSLTASRELGLYRQNYCGCIFSM